MGEAANSERLSGHSAVTYAQWGARLQLNMDDLPVKHIGVADDASELRVAVAPH